MDIEDIRKSYSNEMKENDRLRHFWAYIFIRPLSFYVSRLFLALGFNANMVTIAGCIVLILGLIVLSISETTSFLIIGAILINFWYLIDFTDGNIARVKGQSSNAGALLDWFAGHLYHALLPIAVGIYLSNVEIIFFYIAVVTSLMELSRIAISNKRKLIFKDNDFQKNNLNLFTRLAYMIVSFKSPLLLMAVIFAIPEVWLIFYAIFSAVIWIKYISNIFISVYNI